MPAIPKYAKKNRKGRPKSPTYNPPRKKASNASKWSPTHYVTCFHLARLGKSNSDIAVHLGCDEKVLKKWIARDATLRDALTRARETPKGTEFQLKDYVYEHLPEALQEKWDQIEQVYIAKTGAAALDAILSDCGTHARQALWLHALVSVANYNPNKACRLLAIPPETVEKWRREPTFHALVKGVLEVKKNFFEECLVRGCAAGDSMLIWKVNSTLNRDRGYGEKVEHEHIHEHTHGVIMLEDTGVLTLDQKRALLRELKAKGIVVGEPPPDDRDRPILITDATTVVGGADQGVENGNGK